MQAGLIAINNSCVICGRATEPPVFSHTAFGEIFYEFEIECPRLSGRVDTIPCIAVKEEAEVVYSGRPRVFSGQLRSCNKVVDGSGRLIIYFFVKSSTAEFFDETYNEVCLMGYICKKPVYRKTPFGREITDMLLAVNRAFGRSDYIPVIAWGKNARISAEMEVGQRLHIEGRLQSREYEKKLEDESRIRRTAYEVSSYTLAEEQESDRQ